MAETDEFEKTFQMMTSLILGKKLTGFMEYEEWLLRHVSGMIKVKSQISEKEVYMPGFEFYEDVKERVVTIEEAYGELGNKQITESELGGLTLANSSSVLRGISITTSDTQYGTNSNLFECPMYYNSHYGFRAPALNQSKHVIYSFWPRQSEYMIGCHYVFSSKFCIKCYNSENITRCFEVSDSNNCTDCYFCHNCDNVSNSMFCFNVKSKRYAIANVEIGREKYMEIRKLVLDEIVQKLEKEKGLEIDIYNLSAHSEK
ncbi:TPA: hypothetical protein HA238_03665 [Candidatus Micrarchaeota archaeon]|nr:hypothetical protein [Candidatus Micrarchaeota archaeon]